MLKILGSVLILLSGFYTSHKLTTGLCSKLNITSALIEFTEHIGRCIYTERLPLSEIYDNYSNEVLESYGFTLQLKTNGLMTALETVEKSLSPRILDAMSNLASRLGGINTETQIKLCTETSNMLKEELNKEKETYTEKKKMYRAMPVLLATSIIIMTM